MDKKEIIEEAPKHPPKKRRHMEDENRVLDIWLAIWATDTELSPSERRRAQEERERRKRQSPNKILTVLKPVEGMTPEQKREVKNRLNTATEIRYWTSGFGTKRYQDVIPGSDLVIACPRNLYKPVRPEAESVWAAIIYARNRREVDLTIIMPNGSILDTEED